MFSDNWLEWSQLVKCTLRGTFWMSWDDLCNRFSDTGIVHKQMQVSLRGLFEAITVSQSSKYGKNSTNQFRKNTLHAGELAQVMAAVGMEVPGDWEPRVVEYDIDGDGQNLHVHLGVPGELPVAARYTIFRGHNEHRAG